MTIKEFFAPSAWRLGGASVRRAATALLLCVLTMTVQTAWADTVETYYVDADGTTHTGITATVLTGSETSLEAGTWYYLQTSIAYDHALKLGNGEVTLILGNGATMSFPQADIIALNGDANANSSLTIYGQTLDDSQAGKLVCTGVHTGIRVRKTYTQHSGTVELSGYHSKLLSAGAATVADGSIIVNGGKLMVNYSGSADYAIQATKSITFNGGKMEVTTTNGSMAAVQCSYLSDKNNVAGDITLGWTNASDYIHASNYAGTVTIASGKAFTTDGTDIYSGSGVTGINGKTLTPAVAVTLADGITATGGIITSGDNNYAKVGATVTVSTSGLTVPEGYTLGGITVTPAVTVTDQGSGSYSFTVPAANVSVSAQFDALASSVAYIDENGVVQYKQPGEYTVLTGTETSLGSSGTTTWYVVNSDISYTATIYLKGDVTIILVNGKTMNVGTSEAPISYSGIRKNDYDDNSALTIYGQSLNDATAGTLNIYVNGTNHFCIDISKSYTQHSGNVYACGSWVAISTNTSFTMNGGKLEANTSDWTSISASDDISINGGTVIANGNYYGISASDDISINGGTVIANGNYYGIRSSDGNITINGGQVEATGGSYGIYAGEGTITLGWTNATDYIHANRYYGTVTIAQGQTLYDEDNTPYSGTIEKVNGAFPIDGKTLRPLDYVLVLNDDADNTAAIAAAAVPGASPSGTNVILQGRKLWKDGAWNTLVLPFPIANIEAEGCPLKGATVRELNDASITGTTLTLNFKNATTAIVAGVPYIVKWADGEAGQYTQDPVFQGVTIDATDHSYDNQAGGDTNVRFIGTYDQKTIDTEDRSILFLGAANTLYYPSGHSATTIGACRAYFKIGDGAALARQLTAFNLNFGEEATSLSEELRVKSEEFATATEWYTLDGRKLQAQPTRKGLYIVNGRKVVIK